MTDKKRVGLGKHPRRRTYSFADHGLSKNLVPMDDRTIKPSVRVHLVRPQFNSADSLTFRPLWAMDDIDPNKMLPYRTSSDPGHFSDFIRAYPAAKYVGIGEDRYTFLLYDKADPNYDRRSNPYLILYRYVDQAVRKDRTAPDIRWLGLLEGKTSPLNMPTDLFFLQGLIFQHGEELYLGDGRFPLGSRPEDEPQIIQLSRSAGKRLVELMDMPNPEWTGPEKNYESSMLHGDVVHPAYGRFIRVFPAGTKTNVVSLEGMDDWSSGGGRPRQNSRVGTTGKTSEFGKGFDVSLDKYFISGGRQSQLSAKLKPEIAKTLSKKILFWDEVLNFPSHEEICLMLARGFRTARVVLERAWQDHPEFFTAEVRAVLANAKQTYFKSTSPDHDTDQEMQEWSDSGKDVTTGTVVTPAESDDPYADFIMGDFETAVEELEEPEEAELPIAVTATPDDYDDYEEVESSAFDEVDELDQEEEEKETEEDLDSGQHGAVGETEYDEYGGYADGDGDGDGEEEEEIAASSDFGLEGELTPEDEELMRQAEAKSRQDSAKRQNAAKAQAAKTPAAKAPAAKAPAAKAPTAKTLGAKPADTNTEAAPAPKRRGRPPGSKNRPRS